MLRTENTEIMGWEAAIRGMRNPMNSWEKSDSVFWPSFDITTSDDINSGHYPKHSKSETEIGPNDLDLMKRLRNAGTDHRKFMRMITVYVDVTAPLYWWKEFDTYKVGTVANSCSTMHKIADKEFTLEDFSFEHLIRLDTLKEIGETEDAFAFVNANDNTEYWDAIDVLTMTIKVLNFYRSKYLEAKSKPMKEESRRAPLMKKYWWQMIQLLPSSYNQRRTVLLNYEVLANMYKSRRSHKLDEWHAFCDWIKSLPYSELITGPSIRDMLICNEIMEEANRRITNPAIKIDLTNGPDTTGGKEND